MLSLLAIGMFFVIGGLLLRPRGGSAELRARGEVVESWHGSAFGKKAWLYTVELKDVAGTSWRFRPNLVGGRQRVKDSPVELAYLASDPQATARKIDGLDGYVHWLVGGVGVAVLLGALLGLLT
jgi:hypothetical protein